MNGTPQKIIDGDRVTFQYASPTGRTGWVFNEKNQAVPVPARRRLPQLQSIPEGVSLTPTTRQYRGSDPTLHTPVTLIPGATYVPQSGSYPSAVQTPSTGPTPPSGQRSTHRRLLQHGPNYIDRERVKEGIDVRTTIMVCNIPNEMTIDQFKSVVDSVCFGRYDFIYLRIDFAKNTNVGYAFVNFLTPVDMMKFVDRFDGQEYIAGMGYHPKKGPRLGEMAYATNQGQDSVIEKFRNSSIMCEYPGYRPKLFWSEDDAPDKALIGKERAFPGVNNLSKHNRSKDNAAQIGLYPTKNRRSTPMVRNSQYDRGTPAQMQEDAFYQHHPQMAPSQYSLPHNDPNYFMSGQSMMAMPVGGYPLPYGSPNAYYHAAPAMHSSPLAYAPMTAQYNGSPGPMTSNGLQPSCLRTLTNGHLGVNRRRRKPLLVRVPRDYETAIREIEEGKRILAEHDAAWAAYDAQQAAEAAMSAQAADAPSFTGGEDMSNGNTAYYDGYPANGVQYANGAQYDNGFLHVNGVQHVIGAQYASGVQYDNGVQHAHVDYATGEYANGEHTNGEYTNGEFYDSGYANGANGANGYVGYQ